MVLDPLSFFYIYSIIRFQSDQNKSFPPERAQRSHCFVACAPVHVDPPVDFLQRGFDYSVSRILCLSFPLQTTSVSRDRFSRFFAMGPQCTRADPHAAPRCKQLQDVNNFDRGFETLVISRFLQPALYLELYTFSLRHTEVGA